MTNFTHAVFEQSTRFINVVMKGESSFEGTTFKMEPPKFFGATLHEGTVWRGVQWPVPQTADTAGPFIDAYERLKLEMDRLKKHEDELNFFALELRSRRVMLGPWKGLPIAMYGAVSDYGRSYMRPLFALGVTVIAGAHFLLLPHLGVAAHQWWEWTLGQSFGLSLANTLNVFGFRKDFIDIKLVENLPWWLKVLSGLQTILGGVLLFLFGLGIRNRFRMK